MSNSITLGDNHLLAMLPPDECARISGSLELVELPLGRLLKDEFHRGGLMQRLLLRYTQALFTPTIALPLGPGRSIAASAH